MIVTEYYKPELSKPGVKVRSLLSKSGKVFPVLNYDTEKGYVLVNDDEGRQFLLDETLVEVVSEKDGEEGPEPQKKNPLKVGDNVRTLAGYTNINAGDVFKVSSVLSGGVQAWVFSEDTGSQLLDVEDLVLVGEKEEFFEALSRKGAKCPAELGVQKGDRLLCHADWKNWEGYTRHVKGKTYIVGDDEYVESHYTFGKFTLEYRNPETVRKVFHTIFPSLYREGETFQAIVEQAREIVEEFYK